MLAHRQPATDLLLKAVELLWKKHFSEPPSQSQMLGSACGPSGCDGGFCDGKMRGRTECGEQTGSSCSKIPEAKSQGQKSKRAVMWKSLLYPNVDRTRCPGIEDGLGVHCDPPPGLLAWGKLLPPSDLGYSQSCALSSHDILAGDTSQRKNTVMVGSAVVQGWPDVVKDDSRPLPQPSPCKLSMASDIWVVQCALPCQLALQTPS